MRNLEKYEKDYNIPNFEDYQIRYRKKKILSVLRDYKPQRILEIGCGMEPIFPFVDWDYEKMVIVEPCDEFYKHAQSLINKDNTECLNEYFHQSDALKSCSFDFIICASLLHEVKNPAEILENIAAIATKDTVVHVNVPNAYSLHRIIAKEMGFIDDVHEMSDRNKLFQQNTVFDLEKLKKLVDKAGFEVLEEGSFFVKPFSHDQMYKMIQSGIIDDNVLDGLYSLAKYIPSYGSEIYLNIKLK